MAVQNADGKEIVVGPGQAFEVLPGHDVF